MNILSVKDIGLEQTEECPVCRNPIVRSKSSKCVHCQLCGALLWVPALGVLKAKINVVNRCPECGKEVVRQNSVRYGFCLGNCDVLLLIPSHQRPDEPIVEVCCQIGNRPKEKMTREHFMKISQAVIRLS